MKKLLFLIFVFILIIPSYEYALEVFCPNAVLIDGASGRVLHDVNAYAHVPPASTTKLMTAILTLEKCSLSDQITASATAINSVPSDGSSAGIKVGETLSVEDLLKCIMVVSGNDAANILAEHIAGSNESFAQMMNDKAAELGCNNTHFVNPSGLDDENHYSCAYDLAIMYKYAYNNFSVFKNLASITSYKVPTSEIYPKDDRSFINTNRLLFNVAGSDGFSYYYEYCTGGKTGYTTNAKNCLVASAEKNGIFLIAAVLGGYKAPDNLSYRFKDTIELFDYGFKRVVNKELIPSGELIQTVKIENSKNTSDKLRIITASSLTENVDVYFNDDTIGKQINIDENLTAPIHSGDKVGSITYTIYDIPHEIDLIAENSVEEKPVIDILKIISDILLVIFKVLAIFILLVLVIRFYNIVIRKKKKRIRAKNQRRYNKRFRR